MSVKKVRAIHNKEVLQRINFLQQASILVADKNPTLSCYYGNLLAQVQKKSVIKIDPSIKRNFCRRCYSALTPTTSDIEATDDLATIVCKKCGFHKKYPVNDKQPKESPSEFIEVE